MNSETPGHYTHARRLTILFTAWFVPITALDQIITWVGFHYFTDRIHEFGIAEANINTDFSSVIAYVTPEIAALVLGAVMVFWGGTLKAKHLAKRGQCEADLATLGYSAFVRQYTRLGIISTFLIFLPMGLAIGRVDPVINNIMWLVLGWGTTALFGPFKLIIIGCLAVYAAYYIILKFTLNAEQSRLDQDDNKSLSNTRGSSSL